MILKRVFRLALLGLKGRKKSTLFLLSTIILSVFFLSVIGIVGSSSLYTLDIQNKNLYGEQKIIAWNLSEKQSNEITNNSIWEDIGKITTYGTVDTISGAELGIGVIDETALKLGHIKLLEGNLPQTENEIVLEKSAYKHINAAKLDVGDTVSLSVSWLGNDEIYRENYTIVGFVSDYSAVWKNTHTYTTTDSITSPLLVSFFVSQNKTELLSNNHTVTLLLNSSNNDYSVLSANMPDGVHCAYNDRTYPNLTFHGGIGEYTQNINSAVIVISSMVVVCTVVILLNGFLVSVEKRKRQMALLRTVGATKKQARDIIFCEALILVCIGAPIGLIFSIPLSYSVVRIFSVLNQSSLVFRFNISSIIITLAVCIIAVYVSVLIPAIKAAKTTPIQETRTVYFKNNKVKPRKQNMQKLSPFRLMLISAKRDWLKNIFSAVAFALVIVVVNCMFMFNVVSQVEHHRISDVTLSSSDYSGFNDYIITADEKKESISGTLFDTINRLVPTANQSSPITPLFRCEIPFSEYDEYLNGFYRYDYKLLGIENWEQWGRYQYQFEEQQKYGYSNSEFLIEPAITIYDDSLLKSMSVNVIDGKIDVEAINRGDEIVLCMPDYYLIVDEQENNLHTSNVFLRDSAQIDADRTVYKNTLLKAGDTLTFTWVNQDSDSKYTILKKNMRIGAIVSDTVNIEGAYRGVMSVAVGKNTLNNAKLPYQFSRQYVFFNETDDIEQSELNVKNLIADTYPYLSVKTKTELNLAEQQNRRTTLSIMSMLTVCLLSLGFVGLMNTVFHRVYDRTNEIGLLRCIGMTKNQTLRMFIYEGAGLGVISSVIGILLSIIILPKFSVDWINTATPIYLFLTCMICVLISSGVIYFPIINLLKGSPVDMRQKN